MNCRAVSCSIVTKFCFYNLTNQPINQKEIQNFNQRTNEPTNPKRKVRAECSSCVAWAPEGVLTRQVLYGGGRVGVLEMDTISNVIPGQHWHCENIPRNERSARARACNSGFNLLGGRDSPLAGKPHLHAQLAMVKEKSMDKKPIWRWLRSKAATSLHMRDSKCQGIYAISK
jgi:hypothetical protein